jgi:hypothetical protein
VSVPKGMPMHFLPFSPAMQQPTLPTMSEQLLSGQLRRKVNELWVFADGWMANNFTSQQHEEEEMKKIKILEGSKNIYIIHTITIMSDL